MALIICPECNKEISEKAKACPDCGCPNNQVRCPECSKFISNEITECIHCGYPLKSIQPIAPKAKPSSYKATNTSSNGDAKGCLTFIGFAIFIVFVIITFMGFPGIKVFGISATFIGFLGLMIMRMSKT
jgi:hypothetical protein